MLFPWPRTLPGPSELRTPAFVPIVSTPVRSNPNADRCFFSANSLPTIRNFPNIRGFPFSPAADTRRRMSLAKSELKGVGIFLISSIEKSSRMNFTPHPG